MMVDLAHQLRITRRAKRCIRTPSGGSVSLYYLELTHLADVFKTPHTFKNFGWSQIWEVEGEIAHGQRKDQKHEQHCAPF